MTTESTHAKAGRYLTEGRLTIRSANRAGGVVADVVGDSGLVYRAEWTPDTGWSCNCPDLSDQCEHLGALRLITTTQSDRTPA